VVNEVFGYDFDSLAENLIHPSVLTRRGFDFMHAAFLVSAGKSLP
jgi:hypothetical protein